MSNVVQFPSYAYFSTCPVCGSQTWFIQLDKAQGPNQKIVGIQCSDCNAEMVLEDMEIGREEQ
jgi:hypothetical protein